MTFEQYTFTVSKHFLPAIINGDDTGLDDSDSVQLEVFMGVTLASCAMHGMKIINHHWADDSDDDTNFARCEITNLMADCTTLRLMVQQ